MNKTYINTFRYFLEDTESVNPAYLKFRTLSYKELLTLREEQELHYLLPDETIKLTFINAYNIETTAKNVLDIISFEQKQDIFKKIVEYSTVSSKDLEEFEVGMLIQADKKFESETWKCEECKKRGLHKMRNCKYVPKSEWEDDFMILVDNVKFTECPFNKITEVFYNGYNCYYYLEKGVLPEKGGLYDQTEFFVVASKIIGNKVAEIQNKQLDSL